MVAVSHRDTYRVAYENSQPDEQRYTKPDLHGYGNGNPDAYPHPDGKRHGDPDRYPVGISNDNFNSDRDGDPGNLPHFIRGGLCGQRPIRDRTGAQRRSSGNRPNRPYPGDVK